MFYVAVHYVKGNKTLSSFGSQFDAETFINAKNKQENVLFCEILTSLKRIGK